MTKRPGKTMRTAKRPSAKKPREPETYLGLDTLDSCGKCGAKLPVVVKRLRGGVKVYFRRHLCLACEPAESSAP